MIKVRLPAIYRRGAAGCATGLQTHARSGSNRLKLKERKTMNTPKADAAKNFAARNVKHALLVLLPIVVVASLGLVVGRADGLDSANHVKWDLITVDFTATPVTIRPGGTDIAHAGALKIALTGSGTFVSPASRGTSGAVTGGGTWETFNASGASTGSGTYVVTELVSWQFANFQLPVLRDLVGGGKPSNGNAVLRISYSDGSSGVLSVGCHGPGAPDGILEGVTATKDFATYFTRLDGEGFTVFHLMQ